MLQNLIKKLFEFKIKVKIHEQKCCFEEIIQQEKTFVVLKSKTIYYYSLIRNKKEEEFMSESLSLLKFLLFLQYNHSLKSKNSFLFKE